MLLLLGSYRDDHGLGHGDRAACAARGGELAGVAGGAAVAAAVAAASVMTAGCVVVAVVAVAVVVPGAAGTCVAGRSG
jgi:hypothetical protein